MQGVLSQFYPEILAFMAFPSLNELWEKKLINSMQFPKNSEPLSDCKISGMIAHKKILTNLIPTSANAFDLRISTCVNLLRIIRRDTMLSFVFRLLRSQRTSFPFEFLYFLARQNYFRKLLLLSVSCLCFTLSSF
jgi:hypothetical protein